MNKKLLLLFPVIALMLVTLACSLTQAAVPAVAPAVPTTAATVNAPESTAEVTAVPAATVETPAIGGSGTPVVLERLWMRDNQTGWGLSRQDGRLHLLRTSDGAYSWQDTHLPVPAGLDAEPIQWAAGFAGVNHAWVAPFNPMLPPAAGQVIYHTTDGGSTWQGVTLAVDGLSEGFNISHLQFVDENNGWLMAHVGAGMNHDYLAIFRTRDGGGSWERIVDPFTDTSGMMSCQKNALFFSDAQTGWLTGSCNGVAAGALFFRSLDGGTVWERVNLPDPPGQAGIFADFDAVCATQFPAQVGETFSVEVECRRMSMQYDPPLAWVYSTGDRGAGWQVRSVPVGALMTLPDGSLLILGDEPIMLRMDGQTRNMFGIPQRELQFITPTDGWALSDDGTAVYATVNAWDSWTNIQPMLTQP